MEAGRQSASPRIRVGFVGIGKRIRDVHLPILQQLSHRYDMAGFTTRSPQRAQEFSVKTGLLGYATASELVQHGKPDFLIVAVTPSANETVLMRLLSLQVPLLMETPLAWSISAGKRIVSQALEKRVLLQVAEQKPFLPVEQIKQKVVNSGVLGSIYAAYNDFHTFSYHSIARVRRYLAGNPVRVKSSIHHFGAGTTSLPAATPYARTWQMGSVAYDNQATLFHQYSDYYKTSGFCFPQAIRIYGDQGAIANDTIRVLNPATHKVDTVKIERHQDEQQRLQSLSVTLPQVGMLSWKNPYRDYHFDDEAIAVATLIDGMTETVTQGKAPLYTAADGLQDIEIVQAMRYSASRSGGNVGLPLNETLQKVLMATHIPYWRQKLARSR